MQIVLAAHSLAGMGGSETYLVTVADHLQRLGHDVWVHSPEHGKSTDAAVALGLRVADGEHGLPADPQALIVQDGVVACELALRYPRTPQVFVAHSDIFDLQLPPQLPGLVALVVTLYDRVERRILALAQNHEIVRLSQPVDVERFKPRRPLPERPRVAMTLGNYVHGQRLEMLEHACTRAGIELRHVGGFAGGGEEPAAQALNDADIVFGKARVIHEAMACGRAAYVFDHNGGDGWVTAETYAVLAPDNFGGQSLPVTIDEERLVEDLAAYDAGMGVVNRDLMITHHSATKHTAALVQHLERLTPRREPVAGPLQEIARLIRLYHRADVQAFTLHAETERLGARAYELEAELARTRENAAEELARISTACEHARTETAAAEARSRELASALEDARADAAARAQSFENLIATRRWRALQTALGPADRLRARRRRRAAPQPSPPAPFIVGAGRSGTTLLRLQLDAHPDLAIPPETGFGRIAGELSARGAGPDEVLEAVRSLETWPDLLLDEAEGRAILDAVTPWSVGGGLRGLYLALAAREGKRRWGDKTPGHVLYMPDLAELFPEARFIHLIRDGRAVAASVRHLPFVPGDGSIEAIARDWRDRVVAGRTAGETLMQYREVRYERLVTEPEAVLRELSEFLEIEFDDSMLRAHERAGARLRQLPAVRRLGDGTITREQRLRHQTGVLRPPDPGRIDGWRSDLTPADLERFEAHAGDLLTELGYQPDHSLA